MSRSERRLSSSLPLGLVALVWLAAQPAAGTTFVRVGDEALVAQSPLVAVVRVDALLPSSQPVTDYAVWVEEVLKGSVAERALVVRVPGGGPRDGVRLKIYGAPRFAPGSRALLFLVPGPDGAHRLQHFFLGAFHEVEAGRRRLAVRNLAEVSEVEPGPDGTIAIAPGARRERLRDFDEFARWVRSRASGREQAADYFVADESGELRGQVDRFTLFEDPDDGFNMRWFDFDSGGFVSWRAHQSGQTGVPGGGFAEFQTALQAWNAEPETPIDYRYGGTTSSTNGLNIPDTINTIVFNDLSNYLPPFSCGSGGILAVGGPWYLGAVEDFQGGSIHPIVNSDIVVNSGLSCFFDASPSASKAAEQLFAHELGHSLGLGHSCGDSESPSCDDHPVQDDALMRAFIHDDPRGARLNSDDIAALHALYELTSVPAAPSGLAAVALSTTEIRLTWSDASANETGFHVEAMELGGTFAEVATVAADATTADVGGLLPATGYVFRVRASNDDGFSPYSSEATAATHAPIAPCVPDATTLCLQQGRFQVGVDWKTGDGATGPGSVVASSADSGVLWFFGADNWEMLIKVLAGCPVNDRFWVFFAATTDVQFVLTVVDTQTGLVEAYLNPPGTPADAVTDTDAFATCP